MEPNLQTPPIQPASPITPDKHLNLLPMIIVGIVMFLLGLCGGYLFFANKTQVKQTETTQASPTSIQQINPTTSPSDIITSSIPSDWTIENSKICRVNVPLPPKKVPYYIPKGTYSNKMDDGGYWIFDDSPNEGSEWFKHSTSAIFRNPDAGGSGYLAGGVIISCNANVEKLTSEQLANKYLEKYVNPYDILKLKKKESILLWKQNVVALYIEGGMQDGINPQYFLANENGQYLISKDTMSSNIKIKEATDLIFNNLEFK